MLDQLLDFVKQNTQQEIVENQEIPNEHNEAVMQEASESILNGLRGFDENTLNQLQSQANAGTLSENDPNVQQITQQFSGNLASKFGLDNSAIKAIAIALIPMLISKLLKGNNNASATPQTTNSGFNLDSILGSLLGGGQQQQSGGGNMMDQLSNIGAKLGLDKDGDGKVGLNDFLGGK